MESNAISRTPLAVIDFSNRPARQTALFGCSRAAANSPVRAVIKFVNLPTFLSELCTWRAIDKAAMKRLIKRKLMGIIEFQAIPPDPKRPLTAVAIAAFVYFPSFIFGTLTASPTATSLVFAFGSSPDPSSYLDPFRSIPNYSDQHAETPKCSRRRA